MSRVIDYVPGVDRNIDQPRTYHWYAQTAVGRLWPMCDYGWNRSDGSRFSILRGWTAPHECRLCRKNIDAGKRPVIQAKKHKTRWL